ncbi:DUF3048 domain-containing protein [Patescibacteria group bacterium]|nr:DUF3048 domain-containing protein [Patescibacteria group bacterium]MBU1970682.1 DUF3048 domain-containing protein [Patescibacteria group bacterium]
MEQAASQNISKEPRFINPLELLKNGKFSKKYVLAGLVVGLMIVGATFVLARLKGKDLWANRSSVFKNIGDLGAKPAGISKTVINPLTGVMYTEEEAAAWKDLRPLGVMINNHPDARPQDGLADADFTYEIVAEGGITRFLAFFQSVLPEKVGPVRSVREYYLVMAKEMGDAMLMHWGYSPQALIDIQTWPVRSLMRGDAPTWRENPRNVAVEHTLYAHAQELVKKGLELGWEGRSEDFYIWQFKDGPEPYAVAPLAHKLSYDFWYQGDFSAMWQYDPASNTYLRYMGFDESDNEIPHVDELINKQITASNIIVQFAAETKIPGDEKNRLDYELIGSGAGYIFLDGKAIEVTWSKAGRDARTMYYDMNGEEVKFNRGRFWVAIIPDRSPENLKFSAPL